MNKQATFNKKFKELTYWDTRNTQRTQNCPTRKHAIEFLKVIKAFYDIDQELIVVKN